jgi:hypothetical protein
MNNWGGHIECSDYTEFLQSLDENQLSELDGELVFENILEERDQVVHIQMEIQRRGGYSMPNQHQIDWSNVDLHFLGSMMESQSSLYFKRRQENFWGL